MSFLTTAMMFSRARGRCARRFVRIGSTEHQNGRRALQAFSPYSTIGEESPPRIREYEEDDDEEEKAFAEREKKFTLQRKLFRESLKMKNLERANGFTRKNLDLSASALGMSPAVVDAMMGDGDDVPPELKLLEQCVEDMDEKVKREMLSSPSPTENGDEGFPETA